MLEIVTFPNEILKRKTNPVKSVDAEIKEIIEEMKETMYKNDGIGLAANQVNIPLSIMVIRYHFKRRRPRKIQRRTYKSNSFSKRRRDKV